MAKRMRLKRSSSSGNTSILSAPFFPKEINCPVISHPVRPPRSPSPEVATSVSVRKPSPEKNRPAIFTIGSPVCDPVDPKSDEGLQLGSFLEKCCYCRKTIAQDKEVFMYSILRAFCTAECREKQIDIDKDLERLTAKPKLKVTGKRVGL